MYRESLAIYRAVYGRFEPHSEVATSLNNLGNVYQELGELDKALEKHEKSVEMYRAIHGSNRPHHDIAILLWNTG